MKKLTPEQFWKSEKVKQLQEIQRKHSYGSVEDKAAHTEMVEFARECEVLDLIDHLEEY